MNHGGTEDAEASSDLGALSGFVLLSLLVLLWAKSIPSRVRTILHSETVQFTTKGQVVIPAKFRKDFGIEEGTKASVIKTPEGILLRPITRSYIKSLRGSLKGRGVMKSMMADRRRERAL